LVTSNLSHLMMIKTIETSPMKTSKSTMNIRSTLLNISSQLSRQVHKLARLGSFLMEQSNFGTITFPSLN
jgi:hypothetical protein